MGKSPEEILEFDKVLEYLSAFACSSLGVQRCLNAQIYTDASKIKKELDLTSEARRIYDKALNVPLDSIYDIERSMHDAAKHLRINEEEIMNSALTLRTSRLMHNFLKEIEKDYPLLSSFKNNLFIDKELELKIFETFTPDLEVKEDASLELKRLFQSLRDTKAEVKNSIAYLLNDSAFASNLQNTLYTDREGRTVFQVKAECKNKVKGIIHDVSNTNQTFYIEPECLVSQNNKIREIEILINAEKERILKQLSELLGVHAQEIIKSNLQLIEYDFIFAKARYSASFDGTAAKISDKKIINLKMFKNPVLIKAKKEVVENDFYMDEYSSCMIITGANTGGKTVVLKSAGLLTLMTEAGMHIPCMEAEIYPFKKVYADIGDEQSILNNLSAFSAHMANIVNIVNNADAQSLIVLDEPASGTAPDEGASIALALLDYLQRTGAFTIVSSHYGELKQPAYFKKGYVNASVEFNLKTMQPSYRLLTGIPGASNAIAAAKNAGLKEEIISSAQDFYYKHKDNTALMIEKLQNLQNELSELKKEAEEKAENAERLEQSLNDKLEDIKKDKKKNIHIYKKKYEAELDAAKEEIREILKEMRAEKSEKAAYRSFNRLAAIETKARNNFKQAEDELAEKYAAIDWEKAKAGDKAMIKDLNQEAEILELPDRNQNVLIQIGLLKTKIKQNKLAVLNKNLIKKVQKHKTVYSGGFEAERRSLPRTLDIRGFRAEDALEAVESYLDKAGLYNLTPVYIIHGHGTGVLKQVIRDYLAVSPYVSKFRPGDAGEGGDGISVIDIK